MTIDELIIKSLTSDERIAGSLAKYADQPAIFYSHAPDDNDPSWSGKANYPRINFDLRWQSDPKRGTQGDLVVDIWCREVDLPIPEEIEEELRQHFDGLFVNPDEGKGPYSFNWEQSNGIAINAPDNIVGMTAEFGISSFHTALSTHPNPVFAVRQWLRAQRTLGDIAILDNSMPPLFNANKGPVAFVYDNSERVRQETFAWVWLESQMGIYIYAKEEDRRIWVDEIFMRLAQASSIELPDGHSMRVNNLRMEPGHGGIDDAQVTFMLDYVTERRRQYAHPLNNIHTQLIRREDT